MSEFTASNGMKVLRDEYGSIAVETEAGSPNGLIPGTFASAVAEFFVKENDDRLGRWRWTEVPTFVVYPPREGYSATGGRCDLFIVNEEWGASLDYLQAEEASYDEEDMPFVAAAQAYRAAHPEPKPAWHDAKPGEAWALMVDGVEQAARVASDGRFVYLSGGMPFPDAITAGRRIWPEVQS